MMGHGFPGLILVGTASGRKCPTFMKPSMAMTFISTCALKKGGFRGPKGCFGINYICSDCMLMVSILAEPP